MIALTGSMRSRDSTDDSRLAGFGPDSGSDSVFPPEFGFGSVSALGVRIRIGSGTRGSDSDRFRRSGFGFGSDPLPRVLIRIGDRFGSVRILHPNPGLAHEHCYNIHQSGCSSKLSGQVQCKDANSFLHCPWAPLEANNTSLRVNTKSCMKHSH